jgi:AraC-like DNA-binding protein
MHTFLRFDESIGRDYLLLPNTCASAIIAFDDREKVFHFFSGPNARTVPLTIPLHSLMYFIQIQPVMMAKLYASDEEKKEREIPLAFSSIFSDQFLLHEISIQRNISNLSRQVEQKLIVKQRALNRFPIVMFILAELEKRNYQLGVTQLCELIGYSQRQTYQIFNNFFGMGPKMFCNIRRFEYALMQLSSVNNTVASVSQSLGYYDQAHFSHTFKALSGLTPLEYQRAYYSFYISFVKS